MVKRITRIKFEEDVHEDVKGDANVVDDANGDDDDAANDDAYGDYGADYDANDDGDYGVSDDYDDNDDDYNTDSLEWSKIFLSKLWNQEQLNQNIGGLLIA